MRKNNEKKIYFLFKNNFSYIDEININDFTQVYQAQFSYFLYQLKTNQKLDRPSCWKMKQWNSFLYFAEKHFPYYMTNFKKESFKECHLIHLHLISRHADISTVVKKI